MSVTSIPWVLISVAIILSIIAILFYIVIKKGERRPTDYYTLFVTGLIWFPLGIIMMLISSESLGCFFAILGFFYLLVGIANKKKWKTNHLTWKMLKPKERKIRLWIMFILLIVILGGIGFLVL